MGEARRRKLTGEYPSADRRALPIDPPHLTQMLPSGPPTTPKEPFSQRLLGFMSSVSKATPVFLPLTMLAPEYIAGQCHINVLHRIRLYGGEKVNGWIVWTAAGHDECEYHAVWRSPDGKLFDLTPRVDGEATVLFLPDPSRLFAKGSGPGSIMVPVSRTNRPGRPYMYGTFKSWGPVKEFTGWNEAAVNQAARLGVDLAELLV